MNRKKKENIISVNPNSVRYTQDSILPYFRGDSRPLINDAIKDISAKKLDVDDFRPIRVVNRNGTWWSLDNRRLYMMKRLQERGVINVIKAREVDESRLTEDRLTTKSNGRSIRVRRGTKQDVLTPHSCNRSESRSVSATSRGLDLPSLPFTSQSYGRDEPRDHVPVTSRESSWSSGSKQYNRTEQKTKHPHSKAVNDSSVYSYNPATSRGSDYLYDDQHSGDRRNIYISQSYGRDKPRSHDYVPAASRESSWSPGIFGMSVGAVCILLAIRFFRNMRD